MYVCVCVSLQLSSPRHSFSQLPTLSQSSHASGQPSTGSTARGAADVGKVSSQHSLFTPQNSSAQVAVKEGWIMKSAGTHTASHTSWTEWSRPIYLELARTIYIRYIYGIFGRKTTKYTVIYGVYIRFWPTLNLSNPFAVFMGLSMPSDTYPVIVQR
jgi:hypothetical protein